MKIKTITAKNFTEALAIVKKDLGDEAIILSSEEIKGGEHCVKIVAAIDFDDVNKAHKNNFQTQLEASIFGEDNKTQDIKVLKEEISILREMIEKLHVSHLKNNLSSNKKSLVSFLQNLNIWEDYCVKICDGIKEAKEVVDKIKKELLIDELGKKKFIIMMGPTGVGKTTTIAKLCAKKISNGKKVGIINLDTYRIGAIEQIRIYANIMGVPFKTVTKIDELAMEVEKLNNLDHIFIDTPGKNPKKADYINELSAIYKTGLPIEGHLLLNLTSDGNCMRETFKIYSRLPIDFIDFTKADEAFSFGNIYNISKISRKPISFITTGQKVPQDICFPSAKSLVYMILKNEVFQ